MTEKKRSRGFLAVIVVLALIGACIPCVGIGAAIAIPSFIGYVRRSKLAEATSNVATISRAVAAAYHSESVLGGAVAHVLPPRALRTPQSIGPAPQPWPSSADPAWAAIGFAPADPLYFAYEYEPDADGRGFVVRAYGDLDGDGIESTIELRSTVDPTTGEVTTPREPTMIDELE